MLPFIALARLDLAQDLKVYKQLPYMGMDMATMAYNPDKYREKREKVLGIKKRGISFGVIVVIVSICIISALGFVVLPGTITYIAERNLDDAIYRLEKSASWPKEIVTGILEIQGVQGAVTDKVGTRLVVTFDRKKVDTVTLSSFFSKKGLKSTLLNRVSHRQRASTLKEEKKLEAL